MINLNRRSFKEAVLKRRLVLHRKFGGLYFAYGFLWRPGGGVTFPFYPQRQNLEVFLFNLRHITSTIF